MMMIPLMLSIDFAVCIRVRVVVRVHTLYGTTSSSGRKLKVLLKLPRVFSGIFRSVSKKSPTIHSRIKRSRKSGHSL
jgi:hypothetical protein